MTGGGEAPGPTVTVRSRGELRLNRAAVRALGEPAAVALLYAPDCRRLGLRPAARGRPNAYAARPTRSGGAAVGARAFLRYLGRLGLPTRRYPARMVGGVLTAELGEALDGRG